MRLPSTTAGTSAFSVHVIFLQRLSCEGEKLLTTTVLAALRFLYALWKFGKLAGPPTDFPSALLEVIHDPRSPCMGFDVVITIGFDPIDRLSTVPVTARIVDAIRNHNLFAAVVF